MTLLSYPEKFWKIINQYINSNKSWIPDKNVDKLRKVIEQNERRRELIDKICCHIHQEACRTHYFPSYTSP